MPVQSGGVSGSRTLVAFNIPSKIVSFSLANKTGGAITARVGIIYGSTFDVIYNMPLAAAGSADSGFIYQGEPILLPAHNAIFVSFSGLCDYYFTIMPY